MMELPKLSPEELRQVKAAWRNSCKLRRRHPVWALLGKWAGKADGLPPDLAENHDHYLHGRQEKIVIFADTAYFYRARPDKIGRSRTASPSK